MTRRKGKTDEEMQAETGSQAGETAGAVAAGTDDGGAAGDTAAAGGDGAGEDGAVGVLPGADAPAGETDAQPGADGSVSDGGASLHGGGAGHDAVEGSSAVSALASGDGQADGSLFPGISALSEGGTDAGSFGHGHFGDALAYMSVSQPAGLSLGDAGAIAAEQGGGADPDAGSGEHGSGDGGAGSATIADHGADDGDGSAAGADTVPSDGSGSAGMPDLPEGYNCRLHAIWIAHAALNLVLDGAFDLLSVWDRETYEASDPHAFETEIVAGKLAEYVRKIGDRATPEVLGNQLVLLGYRKSPDLSVPETIALRAFATLLIDIDKMADDAQAKFALANAPAVTHAPTPLEDTTLETVDDYFATH